MKYESPGSHHLKLLHQSKLVLPDEEDLQNNAEVPEESESAPDEEETEVPEGFEGIPENIQKHLDIFNADPEKLDREELIELGAYYGVKLTMKNLEKTMIKKISDKLEELAATQEGA